MNGVSKHVGKNFIKKMQNCAQSNLHRGMDWMIKLSTIQIRRDNLRYLKFFRAKIFGNFLHKLGLIFYRRFVHNPAHTVLQNKTHRNFLQDYAKKYAEYNMYPITA